VQRFFNCQISKSPAATTNQTLTKKKVKRSLLEVFIATSALNLEKNQLHDPVQRKTSIRKVFKIGASKQNKKQLFKIKG